MDRNHKAKGFWGRAINEFLGKTIEPLHLDKDGQGWHVFSFESKRDACVRIRRSNLIQPSPS